MNNTSLQPGDDLLERFGAMLREVTYDVPDTLAPESRLREDLGLDSVAQMELISVVDETLGLQVDLEDVIDLRTVGDVLAVIERQLRRIAEA